MNRRNFITTGLIGVLPIPSIGFASAKPVAKPKTLNELLVKLEQDTQSLIKSKVESWGFTVVEGWPSWDKPETMYYNCSVICPKLRMQNVKGLNQRFLGYSIDSKDIAQVESFPVEVAEKAIKYMQDHRHGFYKIIFLQVIAEYQDATKINTVSAKGWHENKYQNDAKMFLDINFDWLRKDSVKIQNRAHLQHLLKHGRPT